MCLAISNNLLLVLQDAPKRIFPPYEFAIFWSAKQRRKDTFFPPSIPSPRYFLQLQQSWHLYCFAILGSTSTVIHSVYIRNRPGSALRPLATSCAKDYKAHSLQQTSFAKSPNTVSLSVCSIPYRYLCVLYRIIICVFYTVSLSLCVLYRIVISVLYTTPPRIPGNQNNSVTV